MPLPSGGMNTLEDQRRQLIQWIESSRPQGSPNNTVTVVFDGRTDVWSPAEASSARIIFAQGESADQKITRIVEEAVHKKNIVVVTDDRSLQHAVRALGAKVTSVQAFREQARGPSPGPQSSQMGKHISKTLEQKITSELEEIWLREKKGGAP